MDRASSRVPQQCSAKVVPHQKRTSGAEGWTEDRVESHPMFCRSCLAPEVHFSCGATLAEQLGGTPLNARAIFGARSALLSRRGTTVVEASRLDSTRCWDPEIGIRMADWRFERDRRAKSRRKCLVGFVPKDEVSMLI
ncbi:unnamed protein product [Sphagnum tenellum]